MVSSMAQIIQPRTLKGFRDYPPELMIPRERLLEKARQVYRSYGFAPIDTPALEYAEILVGKGGEESDKQMYRFTHHDHDIALRFDLTVPFARFAAQYINLLGTPFKRYHMGPVWRGENTQKGRYREFWQCDFDTIGTTSNAADIETGLASGQGDRLLALAQTTGTNQEILARLKSNFGTNPKAADGIARLEELLSAVSKAGIPDNMIVLDL